MKWFIITLVVASLIGSVMWVMPSPRQRYQANLRLKARQLGIQVHMARVSLPRALGEMEPDVRTIPAYRIARTNLERSERDSWSGWEVLRVDTLENLGLPEHWSWSKGQGGLQPAALEQLNSLLEQLPDDVLGVESTPLSLTFYWDERGDESRLDYLHQLAQPLLEQKI
ncbi:hypothetical protein [Marinobacterium sp. MBR-109]|jgi:hypothetical protein|uniref:hypothetical protein n=1 Tax=Marinobacterium sp. MBR-109 TaxID=3156462 RepID=UPI0033960F1A